MNDLKRIADALEKIVNHLEEHDYNINIVVEDASINIPESIIPNSAHPLPVIII